MLCCLLCYSPALLGHQSQQILVTGGGSRLSGDLPAYSRHRNPKKFKVLIDLIVPWIKICTF